MVSFSINRPSSPGETAPSRSPRRRVLIKGQFQSLTATHPIAVRNLSCTGASVECDQVLKIGGEGVLQAASLDRLCRVIWRRNNVYGIKFDQPLPNPVVLELHRVTEQDVKRAQAQSAKEWFQAQAR